jgi:hypothetical protein
VCLLIIVYMLDMSLLIIVVKFVYKMLYMCLLYIYLTAAMVII